MKHLKYIVGKVKWSEAHATLHTKKDIFLANTFLCYVFYDSDDMRAKVGSSIQGVLRCI